jgi:hypothetical protein
MEMNNKSKLVFEILLAGLLLGALADVLLRATPWGLNLALWTALVITAALVTAARHHLAWSKRTVVALLAVALFAAGFAWRDSPALKALDLLAVIICITACSLSIETVAARSWGVLDYVRGFLNSGAAAAAGAASLARSDLRLPTSSHSAALRHARSITLGLFIALPLLFVFGGLLMAADAVFEKMVTTALDIDFANLFSHAAMAAFFAWIVCGFLLLVLRINRPVLGSLTVERPGLGIVEVALPLALLDLLFLVFVVVQLRYLFGDATLVQEAVDLTYADYARRGFFELVTVAALVLPLLLAADWALTGARQSSQRILRLLAALQLLLLFVIMASAIKRMLLYQSAYGLTELRLYTTTFMLWLGVVLVWFAITVLRGQRRPFASGAVLAGLLTMLTLNVLNPDALVANVNVDRALAGEEFDAAYATSLSADAVPVLLSGLAGLGPDDRCAVAVRILDRWSPTVEGDWRTWNRARAKARRLLREQRRRLEATACRPSPAPPTS